MLHARINPEKCLQKVTYYSKEFEKISVTEDPVKIKNALLVHCQTKQQTSVINKHLRRHVGNSATFTHKALLKKYLSYVIAALDGKIDSIKLSADNKAALMEKLTEGIANCCPGFLDRVYVIIGSFNLPNSIDALLSAYRMQIVERAFLDAHNDEVHTHHRFSVIANVLGYGIPYEEISDIYTGVMTDEDIQKKLKSAFLTYYTPAQITARIWEQARLDQLGYIGLLKDGYVMGDYRRIHEYFQKILNQPNLSLQDCFIIDKKTYLFKDIHWVNINSLLIRYLENHGYFFPTASPQTVKVEFKNHGCELTFTDGNLKEGEWVYQTSKKEKQRGFITDYQHPLNLVMPKELLALLKDQIAAKIEFEHLSCREIVELHKIKLIGYSDFKKHVLTKVKTLYNLRDILQDITPRSAKILIRALRRKLPDLINDVEDILTLIYICDRSSLLRRVLQKQFPKLIGSIGPFIHILVNVSPPHALFVCQLMKDYLRTFFKDRSDLHRLFQYYPGYFRLICEAIKDELPVLLNDVRAINYILTNLTSTYSRIIIKLIRNMLPQIIKNFRDLVTLLHNLNWEQSCVILKEITEILPTLIHNPRNFGAFIASFDLSISLMICQICGDSLFYCIKNLEDLCGIFRVCSYALCRAIVQSSGVRHLLSTAMISENQYRWMLANLNERDMLKVSYCYWRHDVAPFHEYKKIATAFRHIYKAMLACFNFFKPAHSELRDMNHISDEKLIFIITSLYIKNSSRTVTEAWNLTLNYWKDDNFASPTGDLTKNIGHWSRFYNALNNKNNNLFRKSIVTDPPTKPNGDLRKWTRTISQKLQPG